MAPRITCGAATTAATSRSWPGSWTAELASHASTSDPARLAILVALNLADELSRARQQQEGERVEIREKMAELAKGLEAALEREGRGAADLG